MKAALPYLALGAAAISGASAANAAWSTIDTVHSYGQHFFYSGNGSQFIMKGVAYQQDYSSSSAAKRDSVKYTDPLANAANCARDIPYMKQIFTNIIRVYAVDPTANHDDCMNQLAENDIYVVADLSEPSSSINSNDPEWNLPLYDRYTSVISAFAKYNNVIGFFAGNEVISAANQTAAAAFVKAAVRDSKAYIKENNLRSTLGVGYATADVPTRDDLAYYFACEPTGDNSTQIDFWGYNVYSWCGDSDYVSSSYNERVNFFKTYPVPVFFAEYGCIDGVSGGATHRPFTEVEVLYGNMTEVFSGGIVYEWFMAANDYGLVSVSGSSVSPYPDFTSLSKQLAKVTPTLTQSASYTPSNSAPSCPTTGTSWQAKATPLPPTVNPELCSCMMDSIDCTISSNNSNDYGSIFGYLCGAGNYCDGIARNATTGSYGVYGMCDVKQQLAFVANAYYQAQDSSNKASACDFSGIATTQAGKTASTCTSLLSAAGSAGTGSVGIPTSGAGSGSSSSSAGAGRIFGASPNGLSFFDFGSVFFVAYVIAGVVSMVSIAVL